MTLVRQPSRVFSHARLASASAGRSRKKCSVSSKRGVSPLILETGLMSSSGSSSLPQASHWSPRAPSAPQIGQVPRCNGQAGCGRWTARWRPSGCLINVAVGEALLEQFLHHLLVIAGGGAGEQVVAQAEIAQILGDHTVVTVGELLCADAFLVGFHQDRGAVLVGARHHQHVIALHALVARVYVGGHAESGDVTDMTGAVSIRPSNIHQNMTHGARLYKAPYPAFSMYFGSWIFIGVWTCDHRFQSFEIVCIIICISADLSTLLHYVTIIFHISTDFRGLVAQRNSNPLRYRHGHSTTPSGQR